MLFNTHEFVVLVSVVLALVAFLRGRVGQNTTLLVASYVFYGWWDYRFLVLLWASTLVDFTVGRRLAQVDDPTQRRRLVGLSCVVNLGLLGFFKYWNLFASTGNGFGAWLGIEEAILPSLQIVLPVGISFYTFQTLSYSIDVYRRTVPPCDSLLDFALYVAFFPQLVAGPIERPGNLLPTLSRARRLSATNFEAGAFLFASGWFRKSLGDVMATVSDPAFADPASTPAWMALWGVYAFSFQVYLDFSGYTDMARGVARMFGIQLMENFRAPYFATSISDYWRRWHISLSTWLRDYVYMSLGGTRSGRARVAINLMLTMLLGGLWHGAAWNYVVWGGIHGVIVGLEGMRSERRGNDGVGIGPYISRRLEAVTKWFVTFHVIVFTLVFFRAQARGEHGAVGEAFAYLGQLSQLTVSPFTPPPLLLGLFLLVVGLDMLSQRAGRSDFAFSWPWPARGGVVAVLGLLGFILGSGENRAFIYFQF